MTRRLGVIGARGRLGSAVVREAGLCGWQLSLTTTRERTTATAAPHVIVDASEPSALAAVADLCRAHGAALVHAVSALDQHGHETLERLALAVPVVLAPNLTLGHELQRRMVAAVAALAAEAGWTAAVVDRHPAAKRDAPSATARSLAALCMTLGLPAPTIASLRHGLPVADHDLALTGAGEQVTVRHAVGDLVAAARGALRAAAWALEAAPGLWTIDDVWAGRHADRPGHEQGALT